VGQLTNNIQNLQSNVVPIYYHISISISQSNYLSRAFWRLCSSSSGVSVSFIR